MTDRTICDYKRSYVRTVSMPRTFLVKRTEEIIYESETNTDIDSLRTADLEICVNGELTEPARGESCTSKADDPLPLSKQTIVSESSVNVTRMDPSSTSASLKGLECWDANSDNLTTKSEIESNSVKQDSNMKSISDLSSKSTATISKCRNKENTNCEQMNISGGESTGVLLTKALNTLVSGEYEMITPPRKNKSPKQSSKKVALFRPYELDNGKSSERKYLIPTQSPMLFRSNYCSSGQEWLIEKRSKSEAIMNRVNYHEVPQKTVTSSQNPKADLTKLAEEKSDSSNSEVTKFKENEQAKNSCVNNSLEIVSPEPKTVKLPPVLLPLPRPIRSSTPKTSPCPSPNLVHVTPIPEANFQRKELVSAVSGSVYSASASPVPQSIYRYEMCDTMKPKFIPYQQTQSDIPSAAQERPVHVRYHTSVGHRLPLKHSYKHQNLASEQTMERSRSPIRHESEQEISIKDRYRSNSCPPISKHSDMTAIKTETHTNQCQVPSIPQRGVLSSSTKNYIDAVKETWAAHHAVMTSRMPLSSCNKPVLPSFSTFTDKLSDIHDKTSSAPILSENRVPSLDNIKIAGSNQKHVRSRSEEMLQISDTCTSQVRPPSTDTTCRTNLEKTKHVGEAIPVSCYRNFNIDAYKVPQFGSQHATKARTWHVPKGNRVMSPEPEVEISYKHTSHVEKESEKRTADGVNRAHTSGPHTSVSSHQGTCPDNVLKNMHRQWAYDSSHYVKQYGNISEHYATDCTKKSASSCTNNTAIPEIKKHFNPAVDIYKDPTPFTLPLLDPKLRMFIPPQVFNPRLMTTPGLAPGLMHPLHIPRLNVDGHQTYSREDFKPDVTSMCTTLRQQTQKTPLVRNSSEDRTYTDRNPIKQLKPSTIDPRRPLSTSALQNQPVLPTMTPEPKVPLAPLMMMMKNTNQTPTANVEVINGGYGIKNPTFSAPKVQDFPEQCVNPESSKFICKFCNKEFALQRLLNRHLKCHSDSKRYLCTFCGKGFNDTFDLKRHTRIHTGVKPYKCPSCDKAFTQRCSLESHTKKVHGIDLPYGYKQRRTKVYVCEDCGHSTSDPEDHFRHLQQNHPFCPALQRCHDKRQFKFRADPQGNKNKDIGDINTLSDNRSEEELAEIRHSEAAVNRLNHEEIDGRTEADIAVEHLQGIVEKDRENYDGICVQGSDRERTPVAESDVNKLAETGPETALGVHNKNTNVINSGLATRSTNSYSDISRDIYPNQKVYISPKPEHTVGNSNTRNVIKTIPEPTKRLAASEPVSVSPKKKLKSVNSPKKNKSSTSPMKVRPLQFGVSENGGSLPKYDTENVVSKKTTDNVFKKRPLGSLTQNTLNQQKNNLNTQYNDNHIPVVKKPLGNIMGNMQW
ncbi:uncharacterized protein LOC123556579 [Mercenaria mercenaria]|uniref:uncharacterized protein LOC123556579 n=1 Tax=Mercenaria mercenaria TaxID=6596 RepID=UPI00234F3E5F|nr:uncharacterized protein LOC123556579 [Mercenaria mercenaria]